MRNNLLFFPHCLAFCIHHFRKMSDEESFNLSESDDGDFSASEEEYVPGKDSGADSDSDEEIEPSESSQESEDDERVIADNKKKRLVQFHNSK